MISDLEKICAFSLESLMLLQVGEDPIKACGLHGDIIVLHVVAQSCNMSYKLEEMRISLQKKFPCPRGELSSCEGAGIAPLLENEPVWIIVVERDDVGAVLSCLPVGVEAVRGGIWPTWDMSPNETGFFDVIPIRPRKQRNF